jgi:hypothetical protein
VPNTNVLAHAIAEAIGTNPHQPGSDAYYEHIAIHLESRKQSPFYAEGPLEGVPPVDLRRAHAISTAEIAANAGSMIAKSFEEMRNACTCYAATRTRESGHG